MTSSRARRGARSFGLARTAVGLPVPAAQAKPAKAKKKDQRVQLLAINDLHGHLAPDTPGTVQIGCCNPVRNSSGVQTGWTQRSTPAGGFA